MMISNDRSVDLEETLCNITKSVVIILIINALTTYCDENEKFMLFLESLD